MKFVFRADANSNIGQGHVMRCLSLSDALEETGHLCSFVTAGDTLLSLIEKRGKKVSVLRTSYDQTDLEKEELKEILAKEKADVLVADGYFFSPDYFNELKDFIKTVYFDDVYSFAYNVDCLINYNIYADEEKYKELYMTQKVNLPKLILGPSFAPLRKEFSNTYSKEIKDVKEVMVSFGGADPLHLALGFIKTIDKSEVVKDIHFKMVLGRMEPDLKEIKRIVEDIENISLLVDITNMKEEIEKSDLVISAAGSTQYEICACKRPCICFSMADNQVEGAKKFGESGAFIYVGDARNNDSFFDDLIESVKKIKGNILLASEMSEKAGKITDGLGTKRIAVEFEKIFGR